MAAAHALRWVRYFIAIWGLRPGCGGKRVIVQRIRIDQTIETKVKNLARDADGVEGLVPRSTNLTFQPIRGDRPEEDVVRGEIIGVVVAAYLPG
jgi:hypothetical protein